jgi:D-alanyl-D-alanine carboxypeptidase/D-alanyl-D-alanine-endopeptidase (penicillin-binding protein 4)
MKRFVLAAILPICLFWSTPALHADLTDDVNSILHDKALAKVEMGIEIVQLGNSVSTSRIIYRHNSDIPLTPASNLKVVTTSAALDRLGADFKFRTQLVSHNGELILIGDGDPAFGDAELLTRVGWDVTTVFSNWAKQVKQLNLGPIKSVVVDDSIFDENYFHANWPADQRLNRYEAEISGFNLNTNCLDVFIRPTRVGTAVTCLTNPPTRFVEMENQCLTGEGKPSMTRALDGNKIVLHGKSLIANDVPVSITIHDGSLYAATVFNETLARAGVNCDQSPRKDRTVREAMRKALAAGDQSWQVLAVHETPLPQVISRANKDSMNLYGECLCKRIGADVTGQPGSWENGTAAVGAFLSRIGVAKNQFNLDDGCGLSKENLISASAVAQVLVHDYFSPNAKTFMDSLAVAGQDGTLDNRFAGSTLRGRVFAKTGTVNGVSCLSGYLNAQDGHYYAFSILMNKSYAGAGKPTQEHIVAAIDNGTLAAVR